MRTTSSAASENTQKRIKDACQSHNVPVWTLSENALGQSIGKKGRMVIALKDDGMARNLLSMLEGEEQL